MGVEFDKYFSKFDPPCEVRVYGKNPSVKRLPISTVEANLVDSWYPMSGNIVDWLGFWRRILIRPRHFLSLAIPLLILILTTSCNIGNNRKSDIEVEFMLDTLNVGYTYWWPEAGPFIGNCGQELSLVFSGTIKNLEPPTNEAGPLYTPQRGTIAIERVFKIKKLGENTYNSQRFFTTDCFYESGLGTGDTVLVICYDFEDTYTIPGKGSILKIDSFDDMAVTSIRKYIDADENPDEIEKDIGLWAEYGHGRALEQLIECHKESEGENAGDEHHNIDAVDAIHNQ